MIDKKISVIIPLYNTENYINRCLASITRQTYRNLEIIVVDDCSTDKGPELAIKYAENDKRIKLLHHKKKQRIVSCEDHGRGECHRRLYSFCGQR